VQKNKFFPTDKSGQRMTKSKSVGRFQPLNIFTCLVPARPAYAIVELKFTRQALTGNKVEVKNSLLKSQNYSVVTEFCRKKWQDDSSAELFQIVLPANYSAINNGRNGACKQGRDNLLSVPSRHVLTRG
jgi:hypothetical protein